MASGVAALVLAGHSLAVCAPASPVPVGTELQVRLLGPLSSRGSRPGDPLRSVVVAPVRSDAGDIVIPSGAIATGVVTKVRSVGLGFVHESARLAVDFNGLELPGGAVYPLRSQLIAVDNARERIDRNGAIRGIRATASLSHRIGSRVAGLSLSNPAAFVPLLLLQTYLLRFPDPEIEYAAGSDMTLRLEQPLALDTAAPFPETESRLDDAEAAELEELVAAAPYWSYSGLERSGLDRRPVDAINLVFIGSREAIERAFTRAGWTGAQQISPVSGFHLFRAVAELRGYSDAPMRTLLVSGADPDMNWQRNLNTPSKRHHLRIWKHASNWRGEPVWLSAATHDIAMGFSLRDGFTHRIGRNIDQEREKVVNDLRHTGCVDRIGGLRRPGGMRFAAGADREHVRTDGAVTAVRFNSCEFDEPSPAAPVPANALSPAGRLVRRATLSARNYFLRDNLPWRAFEAGSYGVRFVRNWQRGRIEGLREAGGRPAREAIHAPEGPEIIAKMVELDAARTAELREYSSLRRYHLENKRFHKIAGSAVRMTYRHPGEKKFDVLSESGPGFIHERVLRRMLDSELDASREEIRRATKITPANYNFGYLGAGSDRGRGAFLFQISPKIDNKYMIKGRIWVDAQDFAITRIEGRPARNPSVWIRGSSFVHTYARQGGFWLAESNVADSDSAFFGRTSVEISYSDYKINQEEHAPSQ